MIQDAVQTDWFIQAAMFVGAMFIAFVARLAFHNNASVATLIFQGLVVSSAFVVLGSVFIPGLFESAVNQRSIMAIPAMMTIIYALKDLLGWTSGKHSSSQGHRGPD